MTGHRVPPREGRAEEGRRQRYAALSLLLARCLNETGHRVAYPWFEVRGSTWHDDVPSMRDLVVHSSESHSSVWSLTVSNLLDLLEVLTASLSHDPEERSFLTERLADAMRFLRDSTPYPLPDEEIGHHRREAAQRAGIQVPGEH